MDTDEEEFICLSCRMGLREPYIVCMECRPTTDSRLCLQCFAQGYENNIHRNDHAYDVVRSDFALFSASSWTAAEELKLLDLIQEYGLGNWLDVSNELVGRSPDECARHYERFYIVNAKPHLPGFAYPDIDYRPPPIMFKLCDDPPRPAMTSSQQLEMAGYMAARSDFSIEYDQYAELDVKDVRFTNSLSEPDIGARSAVVNAYWRKLVERERRKKIIRDHGLVNIRKITALWAASECPVPIQSLAPFARFTTPVQFDMLVQTYTKESELKAEIRTLQRLRHNGVTRLKMARLYHRLAARRKQFTDKSKPYQDVYKYAQDQLACQVWLQKQTLMDQGLAKTCHQQIKKNLPPLDIAFLPGFTSLNDLEKQFCTTARFTPTVYHDYKETLIAEYMKRGSLRLGQARTLIKIDVNKTRKLYDFLIDQDLINSERKKSANRSDLMNDT